MKIKSVLVSISILFSLGTTAAFDIDAFLVRSIGGPQAYEKIKSLNSYKMTGTINWNGLKGNYRALFKTPDQVKVTAQFELFSIEQGYDGATAWQKDIHGRVVNLAGFEKTEFMRSVYFMSFSYLFSDRLPGRYSAYEIMDADSAYPVNINFYPFSNDQVRVRFDAKTGYPEYQFARLDNLEVETKLAEYKSVAGVMFPFYSISTAAGTPMINEVWIDSVVFDVEIDEADFTRPVIHHHDFHFPRDSYSVTIPFVFKNGHVLVPVEVNGVKKGWFILDTGCSATYYDTKFVGDLGLSPLGEIPSMGLGGFQQIRLVRMDSLRIGQLNLYDQTAGVLPLDNMAIYADKKSTFGGILGYDFFARFPVLIDFKSEQLTVFNPQDFILPDSGVVHPFHLTLMIPTIEARINGISGDFLLDLGNALGLIIHKKFGESLFYYNAIDTSLSTVRGITGIGPGVAGRMINVESLQINAYNIKIPEGVLAESSEGLTGSWEIAGNIGTKVLEQYAVLFDYPRQRVAFYENPK
ncbi:MAG: pepsin/retropepsin-like aspartic protease family protein [Candidatus Zixiibacteriota bacterium]